jgi:hypothetical protein
MHTCLNISLCEYKRRKLEIQGSQFNYTYKCKQFQDHFLENLSNDAYGFIQLDKRHDFVIIGPSLYNDKDIFEISYCETKQIKNLQLHHNQVQQEVGCSEAQIVNCFLSVLKENLLYY